MSNISNFCRIYEKMYPCIGKTDRKTESCVMFVAFYRDCFAELIYFLIYVYRYRTCLFPYCKHTHVEKRYGQNVLI